MALMPVDDALAQLLAAADACRARQPLSVESVTLLSGLGRILACDVIAPINVPPERNSAMDGYAFCFSDLSRQQVFPVSQRIPAGRAPQPLPQRPSLAEDRVFATRWYSPSCPLAQTQLF